MGRVTTVPAEVSDAGDATSPPSRSGKERDILLPTTPYTNKQYLVSTRESMDHGSLCNTLMVDEPSGEELCGTFVESFVLLNS